MAENPDGLDCLVKSLDARETPEQSMAKIRRYYDNYMNKKEYEENMSDTSQDQKDSKSTMSLPETKRNELTRSIV